jgi:hypothetical protein
MRREFLLAGVLAIACGVAACVRDTGASINGPNPTQPSNLPGTGPASPGNLRLPDGAGPTGCSGEASRQATGAAGGHVATRSSGGTAC